jgi:hypothetical protein
MSTVLEHLDIEAAGLLAGWNKFGGFLTNSEDAMFTSFFQYDSSGNERIDTLAEQEGLIVAAGTTLGFDEFFALVGTLNAIAERIQNLQQRFEASALPGTFTIDAMKSEFKARQIHTKKRWEELRQDRIGGGQGEPDHIHDENNVSEYNQSNNYTYKFMNTEGPPADSPDDARIDKAAAYQFNLGQILGLAGGLVTFENDVTAQLLAGIIGHDLAFRLIDARTSVLDEVILGRIYMPGFMRIPEPQPRKYSLAQLMTQNLLQDSDANLSNNGTFTRLYSGVAGGNRAATTQGPISLRDGIIAGVGVRSLQEPEVLASGMEVPYGRVIHNFANDLKRGTDAQDRAFNANIDVTKQYATPAIVHSRENETDADVEAGTTKQIMEALGLTERQFFPFMFETDNRQGSVGSQHDYKQYCLLQAAILSLQESFNPNWSGKHYFGRTEEIHTWTHTSRTLDLRFVIYTTSARELQNLYERTNWLAQQTYGSSTLNNSGEINRVRAGPLVRVTIGDQWRRVPGYIRNLGFNWDHSGPGGKWEMTDGLKMVQTCEVSLSFQIIHELLPDRNFDFYRGLQPGMIDENKPLIPVTPRGTENTTSETYVDLLRRRG